MSRRETKAERVRREHSEARRAVVTLAYGESMPKPLVVERDGDPVPGWHAYASLSYGSLGRIERGWTSRWSHGHGDCPKRGEEWRASGSRGPADNLFATRREALVALRLMAAEQMAAMLVELDEQIEAEAR